MSASASKEILLTREGYLRALDVLARRSPFEAIPMSLPEAEIPLKSMPVLSVGVGSTASVASFLTHCLSSRSSRSCRFISQDELGIMEELVCGHVVILISASGAHPWTIGAITAVTDNGACPYVVTLDPSSAAPASIRRAGVGAVVAPQTSRYAQEHIAGENIAALIELISAWISGPEEAKHVSDAFFQGLSTSRVDNEDFFVGSTRIVLLHDFHGQTAAQDFACRCREVNLLPVTQVYFRDFVHGSSTVARAQGGGDRPVVLAFVQTALAAELRSLFSANAGEVKALITTVSDTSPKEIARGLGVSIGLHSMLVSQLAIDWAICQWNVGAKLWEKHR